jgi:hypothetical protein
MNEPMMSLIDGSSESLRRFAPARETRRADPAAIGKRVEGGRPPALHASAPAMA